VLEYGDSFFWWSVQPTSSVFVTALLSLFFIALSRFTCLVTICSIKIGRSLHHVAGCSLKFNICTETAIRVYPSCHHESGLTSLPVVFFPCRKKKLPGMVLHTGASSCQVFGLTKLHGEDLRNTAHSTNLASFMEPEASLQCYRV
jgi:hypothetical protein